MKRIDYGNRVIVDELFLVILVLALSVAVGLIVFGHVLVVEKPAYIVPRSAVSMIAGQTVISIFDTGGDPVYFNNSPRARYHAVVYIDTRSMTFRAVPAPTLAEIRPGDTIFAAYTGSGFLLTNTLNGTAVSSLPPGKLVIRFVDPATGIQISREDLSS